MSRWNALQLTLNARIRTIKPIVVDDFLICCLRFVVCETVELEETKSLWRCFHCRFFSILFCILVTVRLIFFVCFCIFVWNFAIYLCALLSIFHFILIWIVLAFWADDSFNDVGFFKCFFFIISEQTSMKTKKDDPFVQHFWKQNRLGPKPTDQADMLVDIVIPLLIIIGLLVVNGFIILVIWRHRKKRSVFLSSFRLLRIQIQMVKIFFHFFLYRKNQQDPDQFAQL